MAFGVRMGIGSCRKVFAMTHTLIPIIIGVLIINICALCVAIAHISSQLDEIWTNIAYLQHDKQDKNHD